MTPAARASAPVFIVGGPRSGTAWLFHLLLSSGGFAAGNSLGALTVREQPRRVDCSRGNLLHVEAIKAREPNALFLHIVRDGRDVACSLARVQAQQKKAPINEGTAALDSALYWEWMLREGRQQIQRIGADALEVRFEALVSNPRETVDGICEFIAHDLNYDEIRERGVGAVREPNTAFVDDAMGPCFRPVGRWQRRLSIRRLARVEAAVGGLLEELGYSLYTDPIARHRVSASVRLRRAVVQRAFGIWHWFRACAPLGWRTRWSAAEQGAQDDPARLNPAPRKHTV